MRRMIVDRQTVKNNLMAVRNLAGHTEICAVLSYDAYGLGLKEMAGLLRENGVSRFGVTEPSDVRLLRDSGFTDEEILMLRSTSDRHELEELLDLGAVCTIGSHDAAVALNGIAEARSTIAAAHLKLDCGAGGYGLTLAEKDKILSIFRYMSSIAVTGIYTELDSGFHSKKAELQVSAFKDAVKQIHDSGYETGFMQACGSLALINGGPNGLDSFYVGSALFRQMPGGRAHEFKNAAYAEAPADDVRWIPKGSFIGGKYKTRRAVKIAVLPIGLYHGCFKSEKHGILRTKKHYVLIDGEKARVIGDPTLLNTMVDVTGINCTAGTPVRFPVDPVFSKGLHREYI